MSHGVLSKYFEPAVLINGRHWLGVESKKVSHPNNRKNNKSTRPTVYGVFDSWLDHEAQTPNAQFVYQGLYNKVMEIITHGEFYKVLGLILFPLFF